MELNFPKKPFRTHGGAAVPHRKHTAQQESVVMPIPAEVVIPMQQHAGAPSVPTVQRGESVTVGQKIGESTAFVSAPIHASVSGTVTSVEKVLMPTGASVDAVVIQSDGSMTPDPDLKPPVLNSKEDFLKAVRESGLVGLGGAGFPTHVKLNIPEGKTVDTLIINVAECEPYLTADNREAIENAQSVLDGVAAVKEQLGIHRVFLAVEDNKPKAIQMLRQAAEKTSFAAEVCVLPLRARYPQGAEKVLIQSCTGRVVPMGKLPADVGCVVMNVTSVAFLADYLKTGMPLVKKRLTVDGPAIAHPQNVIVPIGTRVKDILAFVGCKEEPDKVLMGGPMMGTAIPNLDVPILKQNNGLTCFTGKETHVPKATACIRCGRCVSGCPMHLMPTKLETFVQAKDIDGLNAYHVMDCMECGTCAYNCPAGRPLVQAIRLGKGLVRAAGGAKK